VKSVTYNDRSRDQADPEPAVEEMRISFSPEDELDEEYRALRAATEALIFSSIEPLTDGQLVAALGDRVKGKLGDFVRDLNVEYERDGRAFEILPVAGGYQFFTRRDFSGVLRKLFVERARTRLSRAALETLAVVAFRGPVTRAEIDEIRGVDSGGVLRTLLDRHLVAVRGRANVIGRPLLYETTPEFLKHFGLSDLSDLPRDSELLREWGQPRAIDETIPDQPAEFPLTDSADTIVNSESENDRAAADEIPGESEPEKDINHDVA
jgi:segregation and condensation protein B